MTTTLTPSKMTEPVSAASSSGRSLWLTLVRLQTRYPLLQGVIFVIAFGYGAIRMPGFASLPSIRSMLVLASLIGIAAIGQTLVVLLGGFDLSVSGFIVAGALVVTQFATRFNIPFGWAFVLMIIGAGILGGLTGYICHRFRAQPIIVTLAMGSIAVGLVQSQIGGGLAGSAPLWLSELSSPIGKTFGLAVPPVVVIWIVLMLVMAVLIYRTTWGRRLFATGTNPRAAEYSLVRTRRVWIAVFAFSAIAASFAGVLLAGYAGSVDQTIGDPYLFQSLAAVIVGGTAFGGPGDYWRTAGGALLLTVLTVVLLGLGLTGADQNILYGIVILLAMSLYGRERRIRDRV